MKNRIYFLATIILFAACSQQKKETTNTFIVNGTIMGIDAGTAYLLKEVDRELVRIDSSDIADGKFTLRDSVDQPEMYFIRFNNNDQYARVFAENVELQVVILADSIDNATVSGSALNDDYAKINEIMRAGEMQMDALIAELQKEGAAIAPERKEHINKMLDSIYYGGLDKLKEYINANLHSPVSAYMVNRHLIFEAQYPELAKWADAFEKNMPQNKYTKLLVERRNILAKSAVGEIAPDITQNSPDGVPVSLSQFRGKYVLIDFWASWCGPCRRENPNVVRIYDLYKNKNFEIFGVSFDTDKDAWLQAVADDKITWPQVSDLKGWENAAGALYGINSIPHTVLLDPQGKVIAHNLKSEELELKLKEIL